MLPLSRPLTFSSLSYIVVVISGSGSILFNGQHLTHLVLKSQIDILTKFKTCDRKGFPLGNNFSSFITLLLHSQVAIDSQGQSSKEEPLKVFLHYTLLLTLNEIKKAHLPSSPPKYCWINEVNWIFLISKGALLSNLHRGSLQ